MTPESTDRSDLASDGASVAPDVSGNEILARLEAAELDVLIQHAEEVEFPMRHQIFDQGETMTMVYFPLTGMISMVVVLKNGPMIEALTVGKEGFTGTAVLNDVRAARYRGVCQIAGKFLAIKVDDFAAQLESLPDLQRRLRRYSQYASDVVAQSAACNSIHTIEQRCARWLLITADAIRNDKFNLTQEFLSQMLAVRRPGVNVAMRALLRRELISHRYGKVTILDRVGLREAACECYGTVEARAKELLN